MERLTTALRNAETGALTGYRLKDETAFAVDIAIGKLGEYEDLEEKGLLLQPKCKPGDVVWEINKERGIISEFEIGSIRYGINNTFHYIWGKCISRVYMNLEGFWENEIGKTVFLKKEEAEKALRDEKTKYSCL